MLAGGGPADVVELTLALAREMLAAAGLSTPTRPKALRVRRRDGLLAGDDPGAGRRPGRAAAGRPGDRGAARRPRTGWWRRSTRTAIGLAAWRLGAGRARKEDPVSFGAGVVLKVRPGDRVRAGDVLLELRTDDAARIPAALADAGGARRSSRTPRPTLAPLLLDRIA